MEKKGLDFHHYNEGICPFCLKKLSDYRKQLLGELIEITPKNFEILINSTPILSDLGIEDIEFKKNKIKSIKKVLIEKIQLSKEIETIIDKINSFNYNLTNNKYTKIKLSKQFEEEFPQVTLTIEKLNNNIIEINKLVSQLTKTTNKIIIKNESKINEYLSSLGIPYIFKKEVFNNESKIASYRLYHKNDYEKVNRVNALSQGEKNLLALIFFVISSNEDFIIIDDPASSYDETRKGIIFNIICENLKNKTILVLSHDQMFSKYATYEKYSSRSKFKNYIGKIQIVENYDGDAIIKNISKDDFNHLETHIINHLDSNMPYYRKIINLKLLSEIYKNNRLKKNKVEYEYISDILHNKISKEEITMKLNNYGYSELKIINTIKNLFKLKSSFKLEELPIDIFENFDVDELTWYEKIIYEREKMNNEEKKKIIRCEYNNIVHLNNNYLTILNPYKYNYFSPAIFRMIKKDK